MLALNFLYLFILFEACWAANTATDTSEFLPGYGTKWIYFLDGDGNLKIGFLEIPPGYSRAISIFPSNPEDVVEFTLYTKDFPDGQNITLKDEAWKNVCYDVTKPTKIITHGWMSSGSSKTCQGIKDAYLERADVNVIIVNWAAIAENPIYPVPMSQTKSVGQYYAKLIDFLVNKGTAPKNIHLIGHSLGAHVSGFAARGITTGKISRITALDPAKPGFSTGILLDRINADDADYVDVIHTCAGILGLETDVGDADFYPNSGQSPQPGCSGIAQYACSHGRSWEYFLGSIINDTGLTSYRCPSWNDFEKGKCPEGSTPMGEPSTPDSNGSYYLKLGTPPSRIAQRLKYNVISSTTIGSQTKT